MEIRQQYHTISYHDLQVTPRQNVDKQTLLISPLPVIVLLYSGKRVLTGRPTAGWRLIHSCLVLLRAFCDTRKTRDKKTGERDEQRGVNSKIQIANRQIVGGVELGLQQGIM